MKLYQMSFKLTIILQAVWRFWKAGYQNIVYFYPTSREAEEWITDDMIKVLFFSLYVMTRP